MELFLARQLSLSSTGEEANLNSREGRKETKHQNQPIHKKANTNITDHKNDSFKLVISNRRLSFSVIQQKAVVLRFNA